MSSDLRLESFATSASWLQAGFFRRYQPERRPVQLRVTARDRCDHAISDDAYGRHWSAGILCLGQCEPHVLQCERHRQPWNVASSNDPAAIDLVEATAEHGPGHNIHELPRILPGLPEHGRHFAEHLEAGCRHHVAQQLYQICLPWIRSDQERVPKTLDEREAAPAIHFVTGNDD